MTTGKVLVISEQQHPREEDKEEEHRRQSSCSRSSCNNRRRVDTCNKLYTPSSTITLATKITGTETIEETTIIIFDRVKEKYQWW
mmetsp:Transcript_42359/g.45987  ORF Transcript_42359/g.45987 Transcript_42359/m.45987 type:complete len:85 (-) Transcript_42359:152-406(-)